MHLQTDLLRIVAANAALARAEIDNRADFAELLQAEVPASWPPEQLADALPIFAKRLSEDPAAEGWLTFYAIAIDAGDRPVLVASAGFFGPPVEGAVEIGYSVLPEFQRRGYAAEMVGALAEHALAQFEVERVTASVRADNEPSIRLLLRNAFAYVGEADEAGYLRFERRRGPVPTAKPYYLSSIPAEAEERNVSERGPGFPQKEFWLAGELVGTRLYEDGVLVDERAYRGGRRRWYTWHDSGRLSSVESRDGQGLPHGTAYQWDAQGRLLGSYTMEHGSGFDLWWTEWPDGTIELAEVHQYRNGERHGIEWWLNGGALYEERHWQHDLQHGMERRWKESDRLERGYPRFYVGGKRVTRGEYARIAANDPTLPPFRVEDNDPGRELPPEVAERVKRHG